MAETSTQAEPTFNIIAQGVRDFSFENKLEFGVGLGEQPEINVNIQVNGKKNTEETYEVTLLINVEAKQKEKVLFLIELQYAGLCHTLHVPADVLPTLLMIQTPTFLFPYARQIISDTTSQAGLPPLYLQPVDFSALYHSQQANINTVGNA